MLVDNRKKIIYIILSLISILLIGYFDLITGYDFSLSIFYLIPIIVVTWYINPFFSFPLAFVSSCLIIFDYCLLGILSTNYISHIWNAFVDMLFFSIIIYFSSKIANISGGNV